MELPRLLRASGEMLLLPQKVTVTALIYLHKFQKIATGSDPNGEALQALNKDPYRLVCVCLFVAAKANEVVLTSSDVINMVLCMMRPGTWAQVASAVPGLPTVPPLGADNQPVPKCALSGDSYYHAKSSLLQDEQVLLRVLRFRVAEELPHVILLNLCRALCCCPGVTQLAVCLLNDALVLTALAATSPAELLAATALHLAYLLSGVPVTSPDHRHSVLSAAAQGGRGQSFGSEWWIGLGVSKETLEQACHCLLDAISMDLQESPDCGTICTVQLDFKASSKTEDINLEGILENPASKMNAGLKSNCDDVPSLPVSSRPVSNASSPQQRISSDSSKRPRAIVPITWKPQSGT